MTTDELKELIASKIAGQGSAVDAGSALPEILGGVVDLLKNQQDVNASQQTKLSTMESTLEDMHIEVRQTIDSIMGGSSSKTINASQFSQYFGVNPLKLFDNPKLMLCTFGSGSRAQTLNVIKRDSSNVVFGYDYNGVYFIFSVTMSSPSSYYLTLTQPSPA